MAVWIGMFAVSRASLSATPAPKGPGLAILYASSWDGSPELFAADPAGKRPVGQVTFAPGLGSSDPRSVPEALPSPDGRKLVYCDRSCGEASRLWLANADGSDARELVAVECCAGSVTWSPDSRRFAYLCCADPTSPRWGLHVVSADGSTDRIVNTSLHLDDTIVWSSDGRHVRTIAYTRDTRSPNGRWATQFVASDCTLVCLTNRIEVDDASGQLVSLLYGVVGTPAWSPDSRLLAYTTAKGVSVLDPRSGKTRLLSHDVGSELAWSPDGRLLAYTQGPGYTTPGGLRTVTLHGHVHA
jgi:Tol biopolymer transport system component